MSFTVSPLVLEGPGVRLEPLQPEHAEALYAIGQEAADWLYMPRGEFRSLADTQAWISEAQQLAEQGEHTSFAIRDLQSGRLAGSSRYLSIRAPHRSLEIGYTWLGRDFQRSHVNTAAKLCLLSHAFDTLGAVRVELKCDSRNQRSQQAIARLGATREGLFRKHMFVRDNYLRDTVYFSIIAEEWPAIRERLQQP
ncbi:MAG: GNAT family N-acetyltransferase [Pseudomonadales bacterium]|nr:GNAT family N-acetyltransferase [Pseudomonadales bacterium]